jgi:hypothetical protein
MNPKKYLSVLLLSTVVILSSQCSKKDDAPSPSCSDGVQNQNELAVDCGGPCTACMPTLSTFGITNITATTGECGGSITSDGGATVSARGVCWSTAANPTTSDSHTSDGSSTGGFTSTITGLSIGTHYYVRAYAINSSGTSYGQQMDFTTSSTLTTGIPYEGGTIFYIDGSGVHGLVCSGELSSSIQWGCYGTNVAGASGSAIGTGATNTTQIMAAGCATGSNAAAYCSNLTLNGYSDWFLPSIDELTEINNTISLSSGAHWSSTEDSFTPQYDAMTYTYGWGAEGRDKTNAYKLIAARAF